jgi:LL-diaminopimelate aminotransferase
MSAAGVIVTPGVGYGSFGEGYVRLSLSVPDDRLEEAVRRIHAVRDRLLEPAAAGEPS